MGWGRAVRCVRALVETQQRLLSFGVHDVVDTHCFHTLFRVFFGVEWLVKFGYKGRGRDETLFVGNCEHRLIMSQ